MTDLWTVAQVAEYFGLQHPGSARKLLSEYGVERVTGYPADLVKQIPRPGQGARTDLAK